MTTADTSEGGCETKNKVKELENLMAGFQLGLFNRLIITLNLLIRSF